MLMVGTTLPAGVLFFSDKITTLQQYMTQFGCPLDLYILMTTMELPDIIVHCLPAGVLIGTMLVLFRMMADLEITAMVTSGVSLVRIFQPFLLVGFAVALFAAFVNELVVPKSLIMSQKMAVLAANRMDLPSSRGTNDFKTLKKDNQGQVKEVYLIASRTGRTLKNACLFKLPDENGGMKLVYAPKGVFKGASWYLFDGHEYDLAENGESGFRNSNFSKMHISPPDLSEFDPETRGLKPSEMNTMQLLEKFAEARRKNEKLPYEYHFNLNYNFAMPMSCVFLVIASFPVALIGRRRQKTAMGLVYAGFLIVSYFAMEQVAWSLSQNGYINVTLAVWLPGLLIATIGGIFIWFASRK